MGLVGWFGWSGSALHQQPPPCLAGFLGRGLACLSPWLVCQHLATPQPPISASCPSVRLEGSNACAECPLLGAQRVARGRSVPAAGLTRHNRKPESRFRSCVINEVYCTHCCNQLFHWRACHTAPWRTACRHAWSTSARATRRWDLRGTRSPSTSSPLVRSPACCWLGSAASRSRSLARLTVSLRPLQPLPCRSRRKSGQRRQRGSRTSVSVLIAADHVADAPERPLR